MNPFKIVLWLFLGLGLVSGLRAGEPDQTAAPVKKKSDDKSHYTLFHPTPDNQLRSYSADRPSQSLGPYTVDAGHFYFETSVISYLFDQSDGTTVRQYNIFPFNFRMGLTNNVEFDLAYGDYIHLRVRDRVTGRRQTQSGFGDLILQSKINLLGDDGGTFAFGLIPFLKVPTNTGGLGNHSVEGGLGVPLAISLPAGFTLGLETGANFIRNATDTGYRPAFFNAVILSHCLFTDRLSVYGEFYSVVTEGADSSFAGYIDTGLVYQILPNAEVDLGCNFGVTRDAPDYQPFTGFSFRF